MQSVEVDVPGKTATVTAKPGASLTREQCARALEGSQYSLTGFEAM